MKIYRDIGDLTEHSESYIITQYNKALKQFITLDAELRSTSNPSFQLGYEHIGAHRLVYIYKQELERRKSTRVFKKSKHEL